MLRFFRWRAPFERLPRGLRNASRWKSWAVLLLASLVVVAVARWSAVERPLGTWLVWDYLLLWGWQAILSVACVSCGHALLRLLVKDVPPALETAVLSMGIGVVAFVVAMYIGGALGVYGPVFSVALPLGFFGLGVRSAYRAVREAAPLLRPVVTSRLELGCWAFGVVAAFLLYLQSATPDAITYDATWSHLTVAEDYAREGRIVPFLANTPKNLPHLASFLYTWDFSLPGLAHPALKWMAAQHTEILLFGWTLAGVGACVAWILPEKKVKGSWAALFLFPGFYVYDSNLGAAADHIAAFFAVPFFLSSMRASQSFAPGWVVLSGCFAGALLHTKFQCMYLIAPMALWFILRWLWLLGASLRRRHADAPEATRKARRALWVAPWVHVGAALFTFGPHLMMNWIFYHNPVYPLLLDAFPSTPVLEDFSYDPMQEATASPGLWAQLERAVSLMFTFSFRPQYTFIGNVPTFGTLFTCLIPVVLLKPRDRRLWGALLLSQGAIFAWAFVYPVDRNLQLLLPWLAAYTAAALMVAWSWGLGARVGIGALVALQLAWGGKFMLTGGDARVNSLVALVKTGSEGSRSGRYDPYRSNYRKLSEKLPQDAVVLLHTLHTHLGIDRRSLTDWAGWQYVIDYRKMKTPRDVYQRYRELGVTHIIWNNRDFPAMKQEDVLFFAFTRRHAKRISSPGFSLWEMPENPPPEEPPLEVVTLGLHGYENGRYDITDLGVIEEGPNGANQHFPAAKVRLSEEAPLAQILDPADAILLASDYALDQNQKKTLARCFQLEHRYYGGYRVPSYSIYLRKPKGCLQR